MNDFLLQYYKMLHFRSMPAEIRAQYDTYLKADDFRGNMKDWKDYVDANGDNKDLPDPGPNREYELDQAEWEKLFKAFQSAFRSMDASKKSFKENKKATAFLNEYFGTETVGTVTHEKLFTLATAGPALEQDISDLAAVLTQHKGALSKWLKTNGSFFEDDGEYDDFIKGLSATDKKYNKDAKFQKKLKDICDWLTYGLNQGSFDSYTTTTIKADLTNIAGKMNNIQNGFDSNARIDPAKLAYFKTEYSSMLRKLYTDTKVREVFAENDGGKISKQLNQALEKTAYDNKESKDYVPPKRAEELTLGQQISNLWGDTYENYLEKFVKLRRDRLFFSPEAQTIVKAIDGAKIKPTDGLAKVLAESAKIKEKLQYKSPKAAESFDWFEKTMKELQSTMGKTFDGALKNGHQMKAIVSEMAMMAVRDGKVDQAKVAMEVLSVIKYAGMTSKIMDAIKKEPLSIFSDKSLSWNKNAGVQFVTTAFDKSLKAAFMGVGYGITYVGNKIKLSGSKFHGNAGRMKEAREDWANQTEADKNAVEASKTGKEQAKIDIEDDLAAKRARGLSEANLNTAVTNIEADIVQLERALETYNTFFSDWLTDPANHASPDHTLLTDYFTTENAPVPTLTEPRLQTRLNALNIRLRNHKIKQQQLTRKKNKLDEFATAQNNITALGDQITAQEEEIRNWDDEHKDQYMELMAHWDFLQTGSNVKGFMLGSKKAQQKRLDENISTIPGDTLYRRDDILAKQYDWYENQYGN